MSRNYTSENKIQTDKQQVSAPARSVQELLSQAYVLELVVPPYAGLIRSSICDGYEL